MENDTKRIRMAIISGASHALHFKYTNPKSTEEDIMQYISDNVSEILKKIDSDLE